MEKVLFVSNALFLNTNNREGGVRNCTFEFIQLLRQKFEVVEFPIDYLTSVMYKTRVKSGLNHYNDYNVEEYRNELSDKIKQNDIRFVFLNLSNTIRFSSLIKDLGNRNMKVILCSHGNETGDLLHQAVRFRKKTGYFNRIFSSYTLGRLLKIEAFYRIRDVDMTLAVSPVEENIEKWLGSRATFMVPRVINKDFLPLKPVLFRVGFMGDLSHTPNQTGIISFCEALKDRGQHRVEFRLVGSPEDLGKSIVKKYPFVKYLGFLNDQELREEVSSWTYFLNLVFYYSRGVSTKMAKALGWGLPVISTIPGNRGYQWSNGELLLARDPAHMAELVVENAGNMESIKRDQQEVIKIVSSSPDFQQIMDILYPRISDL